MADTDSINIAFEEFITKIVDEKSVLERTTTEAFLRDGGLATIKVKPDGDIKNNLLSKAAQMKGQAQTADAVPDQPEKNEGTIKLTNAKRRESIVEQQNKKKKCAC